MKKKFRIISMVLAFVMLVAIAIPQNIVFANNESIVIGKNEAAKYEIHTLLDTDKQSVMINLELETKEKINIQKVTLPDKSEVPFLNSIIGYRVLENNVYIFTLHYKKTGIDVTNDKKQADQILTVDIKVEINTIEKQTKEVITKNTKDNNMVNKEGNLAQISSWAELVVALADIDVSTIEITQKIEIEDEIVIPSGRTVHFTGSGSLIRPKKLDQSLHMLYIEEGGNLYLEGITIDGNNVGERFVVSDRIASAIEVSGKLTLVSGIITRHTCYVIHISGENAEFYMEGGSIEGNEASSGVFLEDHANFTMDGGEITNNRFDNYSTMEVNTINLLNGSKFVLNYGSITNNRSYYNTSSPVMVSGGNSNKFEDAATFIMNNGEISNNYSQGMSGGVTVGTWVNPDYRTIAKFQMNGGKIVNNTSKYAGGGVLVICNGEFEMNDGQILNNKAPMGGGIAANDGFVAMGAGEAGFDIKDWGTVYKCPAAFTMNGGIISGNSTIDSDWSGNASGAGGGIYVASNMVTLHAGEISNNTARDQGGGVYVGSIPYELRMYNTLISDNKASLLGGGIWSCPTGSVKIHVNNGGALFDNTALTAAAGDDYVSVPRTKEYITTLASRMLGARKVTYYEDGKVIEAGVLGKPDLSVPRFDPANPGAPIKNISNSKDTYALKAVTSQEAKDAAKAEAKLIISGNTSERGGGIGTNGSIVIGKKDNDKTIHVEKKWDVVDGITPVVEVDLIRIDQNGNKTVLETIELNKMNHWRVTFDQLPLQYTYDIKEHAMKGYETTYEKFENGNEVNIIIKNTQETINKKVMKVWDDNNNQDGIRPNEVGVQLYANGEAVSNVTILNKDNDWKHTFTDLIKYKDGREIKYTIQELGTIFGYESKIENDREGNFVLTNIHAVKHIDKTVVKIWDDNNDQDGIRPNEVKVQLLANGKNTGEALTLSKDNKWSTSWNNLPKYEYGKEINYSIEEVTVSVGYTNKINIDKNGNFIITNTHVPAHINELIFPSNNKGPQTVDDTSFSIFLVFISISLICISVILVKKKQCDINNN